MKSQIINLTLVFTITCLLNNSMQVKTTSNLRYKNVKKDFFDDYSHFAEDLLSAGSKTRTSSGFSSGRIDRESKTLDLNFSSLFRMGDNIIRATSLPPVENKKNVAKLQSQSQIQSQAANTNMNMNSVNKLTPSQILLKSLPPTNSLNTPNNVNSRAIPQSQQKITPETKHVQNQEVQRMISRPVGLATANSSNPIAKHVNNFVNDHKEGVENRSKDGEKVGNEQTKEEKNDDFDELFQNLDEDDKNTKDEKKENDKVDNKAHIETPVKSQKTQVSKKEKSSDSEDDENLLFE